MVEQVKAVDYKARKWKRIGRLDRETLDEVLLILDVCPVPTRD